MGEVSPTTLKATTVLYYLEFVKFCKLIELININFNINILQVSCSADCNCRNSAKWPNLEKMRLDKGAHAHWRVSKSKHLKDRIKWNLCCSRT